MNKHFKTGAKDKLGDYIGALADYNKAIEINPKFAEAYYSGELQEITLTIAKGR